MSKIALFDMDGTLSDDSHRRHLYVPGQYTEYWTPELIMQDPPFSPALELVNSLRGDGWSIGVMSARRAEYNRKVTEEWLALNGVAAFPIFLRGESDKDLSPAEFKTKAFSIYMTSPGVILFEEAVLYDNDPDVVNLVNATYGDGHAVLTTWDVDEESPA